MLFQVPGEEHVRAEAMHPTWKDSQLVGWKSCSEKQFLAIHVVTVCALFQEAPK